MKALEIVLIRGWMWSFGCNGWVGDVVFGDMEERESEQCAAYGRRWLKM
jgi:hypothetical protein